jgi:hypothetical protein
MAWVRDGGQLNVHVPVMGNQTKVDFFMRTLHAIRFLSGGRWGMPV